jgi:hypothetical protein
VLWQVFYRQRSGDPPGRVSLSRNPRLLTGSERWFILPTSNGDIVLRLDLDSTGEIVGAFEARSGMKVTRSRGELGG